MYTETGKGEGVHSDFFKFLKNIRKLKKNAGFDQGFYISERKGAYNVYDVAFFLS